MAMFYIHQMKSRNGFAMITVLYCISIVLNIATASGMYAQCTEVSKLKITSQWFELQCTSSRYKTNN